MLSAPFAFIIPKFAVKFNPELRCTIPLTPEAINILERQFERRTGDWFFTNRGGERLSYEALCYHKGMDVKILSRLLGHADVNITYNLYIHLYGDGFDEMYSALVRNA